MLDRISGAELTEWIAFYSIEPWGSAIEDERAGAVAAMVHNCRGMISPAKKPILPADVFPRIKPPARRQTTQEMIAELKRATIAMGGRVV
jgi:hypothetical protein